MSSDLTGVDNYQIYKSTKIVDFAHELVFMYLHECGLAIIYRLSYKFLLYAYDVHTFHMYRER